MSEKLSQAVDTSTNVTVEDTTNTNNNIRRPRVKKRPKTSDGKEEPTQPNVKTQPNVTPPTDKTSNNLMSSIQEQLKTFQEKLDSIELPENMQRMQQKIASLEKQQQTQKVTVRVCYDMMFIMLAVIGALFVTVCYLVYKYVYPAWRDGRLDLSLFLKDTNVPDNIQNQEPVITQHNTKPTVQKHHNTPVQKVETPPQETITTPVTSKHNTPKVTPTPQLNIPLLDLNKIKEHIKAPNPFSAQA